MQKQADGRVCYEGIHECSINVEYTALAIINVLAELAETKIRKEKKA